MPTWLLLNNCMNVVIYTHPSINTDEIVVKIEDLNRQFKTQGHTFDIPCKWQKLTINLSRKNISKITIEGVDIGMILNSGSQYKTNFTIWLHGDIGVLKQRIVECIDQDDLLRWMPLNSKYLLTESYNESAPAFVPDHIQRFFERGEGPYWWNYNKNEKLPYRSTEVEFDKQKLLESLDEDLTYVDKKFSNNAICKSLQASPQLPLTPVTQLKNDYLKKFLTELDFKSMLQIQYVEMEPKSFIDIHMDDFANDSGLMYIRGASQLYCVLKGDSSKFKLKFARAGMIDVTKPTYINNNAFAHSLYYDGEEPRGALLIYGNT